MFSKTDEKNKLTFWAKIGKFFKDWSWFFGLRAASNKMFTSATTSALIYAATFLPDAIFTLNTILSFGEDSAAIIYGQKFISSLIVHYSGF